VLFSGSVTKLISGIVFARLCVTFSMVVTDVPVSLGKLFAEVLQATIKHDYFIIHAKGVITCNLW